MAKTLAVTTLAGLLGLSSQCIQFTPERLPSDLTGTTVCDPRQGECHLRIGPACTNLLLNRV